MNPPPASPREGLERRKAPAGRLRKNPSGAENFRAGDRSNHIRPVLDRGVFRADSGICPALIASPLTQLDAGVIDRHLLKRALIHALEHSIVSVPWPRHMAYFSN
jgi:hypothetical protein